MSPLLLLSIGLTGCESWFAPAGIEVLGLVWGDDPAAPLENQYQPLVITLPDSVEVGRQFLVKVRTYLGCRESKGSTVVNIQDSVHFLGPFRSSATITVRTHVRPGRPNENCAGIVRRADHVAKVTFTKWGSGTVHVNGEHRYIPLEGGYERVSPIQITRTVVVKRVAP